MKSVHIFVVFRGCILPTCITIVAFLPISKTWNKQCHHQVRILFCLILHLMTKGLHDIPIRLSCTLCWVLICKCYDDYYITCFDIMDCSQYQHWNAQLSYWIEPILTSISGVFTKWWNERNSQILNETTLVSNESFKEKVCSSVTLQNLLFCVYVIRKAFSPPAQLGASAAQMQ